MQSLMMLAMLAAAFQNPARTPRTFDGPGTALVFVVMGDSTAAGRGADYESGIAVGTATHLAARRRVVMTNLGISGARIHDLIGDQLPVAETLHPDVVLLSVAANDVTHLTRISSMEKDLREIVRRLRSANSNVLIVITGSPDMGAPPRVPRLLRPTAAWQARRVNRAFRRIAAEEHLTFAPIADETGPLLRKDPTLFEADRFHPNERGYATWIAVLNRALNEALRR